MLMQGNINQEKKKNVLGQAVSWTACSILLQYRNSLQLCLPIGDVGMLNNIMYT